jgi:uncharacterized coiled-coil protein SlyX
MRKHMKIAISTIALIVAMTGAAGAACNVSGNIVAFTVTGQLNESDCASAATVGLQGTSIANLQSSDSAQNAAISGIQSTVTGHTAQIGALQTSDANQNAAIILNYAWDSVQQAQIGSLQAGHAAQGTAIVTLQGTVSGHTTTLTYHGGRITALETNDAAQDATLNGHTTAIGALQSQTALQQDQLDSHEQRLDDSDVKNGEQDDAIEAEKVRNDDQDERLDKQKKAIKANYAWDKKQQGQIKDLKQENQDQWDHIGSLELATEQQGAAINAHSALLSQHTAKLEDHSKGLAIAMAMPDAWLSDKKRFGVFGAIGGFDGETAMGFAAIGRIDDTFSLNAKLGADMDFDQFGWQVGLGAQW